MSALLDDRAIAQRILDHIDNQTTDLGESCWREPVENYRSPERLELELERAFRTTPTPLCPSAALPTPGSYLARDAAGVPLLAVRGADGVARVFRNACRHRGTQLACGRGREKAFVCRYHGWAYGLDGALRNVPHDYGFPELDKTTHGLVPVRTEERSGIVFVTQQPTTDAPQPIDAPDGLLGPELQLIAMNESVTEANWKIVAEGFLEGYHIFSTHRESFYPVQFDNLNVIERFGRNSRVTFPYRNIQKLRTVEPEQRRVAGTLTHVYHFFPNVIVATFPKRMVMTVLEPQGISATRTVNYTLAAEVTLATDKEGVERDAGFVNRGAREDRDVVESIQRGMASGANEVFEFGRFEAAIVHFHRNLDEAIAVGA